MSCSFRRVWRYSRRRRGTRSADAKRKLPQIRTDVASHMSATNGNPFSGAIAGYVRFPQNTASNAFSREIRSTARRIASTAGSPPKLDRSRCSTLRGSVPPLAVEGNVSIRSVNGLSCSACSARKPGPTTDSRVI
jgi:hypothetical protein